MELELSRNAGALVWIHSDVESVGTVEALEGPLHALRQVDEFVGGFSSFNGPDGPTNSFIPDHSRVHTSFDREPPDSLPPHKKHLRANSLEPWELMRLFAQLRPASIAASPIDSNRIDCSSAGLMELGTGKLSLGDEPEEASRAKLQGKPEDMAIHRSSRRTRFASADEVCFADPCAERRNRALQDLLQNSIDKTSIKHNIVNNALMHRCVQDCIQFMVSPKS